MGLESRSISEADQEQMTTRRPLNALGQWMDEFRASKHLQVRDLRGFGIAGVSDVMQKDETTISLYVLQQILQKAPEMGATEDQMAALSDTVTGVIQRTLAKNGRLYDRVPPRVPRAASENLPCITYTDTAFARSKGQENLHNRAANINHHRNRLGFSPVFTEEEAEQIEKSIDEAKRRRDIQEEKRRDIQSPFAKSLVQKLDIPKEKFQNCRWARKENGTPKPEEFGVMLMSLGLPDDKREQMVALWLEDFRSHISIVSDVMAEELGITKQRMSHLKLRVDPDGTLSSWEAIEAIREFRQLSLKDKFALRRGIDKVIIADLAREYDVNYQAIYNTAKMLDIVNTRNLSVSDVERIREARNNPPKRGRPRKHDIHL